MKSPRVCTRQIRNCPSHACSWACAPSRCSAAYSPSPADTSLVLGTLQPLTKTEPERACYRLIGGVLVQRTVKDVVPALETNYGGIKEVLETLVKTYKGKEEEFNKFQREHKIQVGLLSS